MGQNLALQSQSFNAAPWGYAGSADVPVTNDLAPDGTTTACRLRENGALGLHYAAQTAVASTPLGKPSCLSVYAHAAPKGHPRSWIFLGGNGTAQGAYFNLGAGALGTIAGGAVARIVPLQNAPGWWRCSILYTPTLRDIYILLSDGNAGAVYQGDGVSYVDLWGAQFEQSNAPGDYTPTVAAAVNATLAPPNRRTLS